jgi:ABC-type glycerol-3-phosphate transport system permease component
MAAVTSRAQRIGHPLAIVAIVVATLIFLSPIYWIASTAFKPRAVATSVPPTVIFTPEVTPFVKLFTKRVQLREQPSPEVYDAAPWWEKAIFDGGERVLRVGQDVQLSQYPNRFTNSLIVAIISTVLAVGMGTFTAYGFSRFRIKGESDLLFFILSTRMLPPIVVAIPMFLMYRIRRLPHPHRAHHPYTAFNLSFSVWLMISIDDPRKRRPRWSSILAPGRLHQNCASSDYRHRRDRGVLLHHRLERIRLRPHPYEPPRPDRAALHPVAGRIGPARMDGDCRRHGPVPVAGRDLHLPAPQSPVARRHLRRDPQMNAPDTNTAPRGTGFAEISTRYLEPISQWTMVLGIIALCQPWVEFLHRYGATITVIGLAGFIIFSHVKPTSSGN